MSPEDRLSEDYQQQLQNLFYRVSYFAKAESKVFGIGQRTFGIEGQNSFKVTKINLKRDKIVW